jgi:hypothetical protein
MVPLLDGSERMDLPVPTIGCSLGSPGPVHYHAMATLLQVALPSCQLVDDLLMPPRTDLPGHQGLVEEAMLPLQLLL